MPARLSADHTGDSEMDLSSAISEIRSSLEMMARLSVLIRDAQALCMGQINEIAAHSACADNADEQRDEIIDIVMEAELPATPPIFNTGRFMQEDPYPSFHLDFFLDDY